MCAVSSVSVFCSSLILCFPGMLLRYCLNDLEMLTVAPIITGIAFVFILLLLLFGTRTDFLNVLSYI